MLIEEREYTIRLGRLNDYLSLFTAHGLPIIRPHFGEPYGLFTTDIGDLSRVVMMWRFDSYAAREQKREQVFADERWPAFARRASRYVLNANNRILVPVPPPS